VNKVTNWQRFWYITFLFLIVLIPYNYGYIKAETAIVNSCSFNSKFYYSEFQLTTLEYKYLIFDCPHVEIK
jgi:hypothetical protein